MIISQVVGWNAKTWKPANLLKTDAHPTLSQELCEVKARIFMESLSMQMDIKYVYIYIHISLLLLLLLLVLLLLFIIIYIYIIIYQSCHTRAMYIYI